MRLRAIVAASIAAIALCAVSAPIRIAIGNAPTGDGGRGFGVLAAYPVGGPRKVVITRKTLENAANIKTSYFQKFGNLCNLRVYDPDGYLVAYLEMGDQTEAEKTYVLEIPEGKQGLWRFSIAGGFVPSATFGGDEFTIEIPDSPTWGVRGEKILKLIDGFGAKGWMAFSPDTDRFYLTGKNVDWKIDGRRVDGETGRSQYGNAILARKPQGAELLEVEFGKRATLFVDGLPGLVSPTADMARRLCGGLVRAKNGEWLEGPVQARAMNLAMKYEESFRKLTADMARHDLFVYKSPGYRPGQTAEAVADGADAKEAIVSGLLAIAHMDASGALRKAGDTRPLDGGRIDCATMFEPMHGIARGYRAIKPFLSP